MTSHHYNFGNYNDFGDNGDHHHDDSYQMMMMMMIPSNICLCNMIMNSDEMKAPYRLTPTLSPPMFGELGAIIRNYYQAMMAMMGALSPPLMPAFPLRGLPPADMDQGF